MTDDTRWRPTCPRRTVLAGFGGLALLLAGCGQEHEDEPGTHAALRLPRGEGAVAFLCSPGGRDALLALKGEPGVLVGLGAALGGAVPPMPPFPGEILIPERSNTDAFLQVEGEGAAQRLDELLRQVPGEVTWRTAVRRDVVDPAGKRLQRNPFGFVEGHTNTSAVLLPDGGSLLAVRVIRLAHEQWAADPPESQARIIGRHPDGTWLDGTAPDAAPSYDRDPEGRVTPLDSHVRTMNPRTGPAPAMLRRSWNYHDSPRDSGVLFMAFQADLGAGFALAQSRLTADALHPYLLTVGGGYFHVPGP